MKHCAVLLIFCLLIQVALAQNSKTSWSILQSLPAGLPIVVKTASGQSHKGQFRNATDSSLDLIVNNKVVSLRAAEVSRVYALRGRPLLKGTLIGMAAGTAAGAGIGAIGGRRPIGILGQGAVTAISAGLGFILGSIAGLVVGSTQHKKELVYESSSGIR